MSIVPIQMLLDPSKYSLKSPFEMEADRYVVHNTANDACARNEISYMINNSKSTSFHYAIDDKEVVQGLPEDRNGYHAGDGRNGAGNRKGIGIEICYSLSGGEKFIQSEKLAAKFLAQELLKKGWGIERVTKHQDYTGKYCPHRTLDMGWQRFINMIKSEMNIEQDKIIQETTKPIQNEIYNIITTLKGYYTAKNAIDGIDPRTIVNPGTYYIFNISGDAINISRQKGKPGSWISIKDNTINDPDTTLTNIVKGDTVKVNKGAKTYTGGKIASFVYDNVYIVDEIVGDRAVLDKKGICTPVNVKDLTEISLSNNNNKSEEKPKNDISKNTIKEGSLVRVNKGAKTYTGGKIASFVYYNTYIVDEIVGNRAVLDKKGICTPVNVKDLTLVQSNTSNNVKKIEEGSLVRVKRNAKTYTGGKIASFVYDNVYVIDELKGDRAVLDKKGICTPVNVRDLILV